MINPIDFIIPVGLVITAFVVIGYLGYQILGLKKDISNDESLFKQGGNN